MSDRERAREIFEKVSADTYESHGCVWTCTEQEHLEQLIAKTLSTVRAEQIEKDARIAENFKYLSDCNCDRNERIAQAIRTQEKQ